MGITAQDLSQPQSPTFALAPPYSEGFWCQHPHHGTTFVTDIVKLRLKFPCEIDIFGCHTRSEHPHINQCGLSEHSDDTGNTHDATPDPLSPAHQSNDGTEFN